MVARLSGPRMRLRSRVQVAVVMFALMTVPCVAGCQLDVGPEKTVVRILDGETLALDDGSHVRLVGVLAPRADDPTVADGSTRVEQAGVRALEALTLGKNVQLRFDRDRKDRHGRWLAHVIIQDGERWLQAVLLEAGHMRADAAAGQRACIVDLIASEAKARAIGAGLWQQSAYRVRAARPARDIAAYLGSFQIVSGEVHAVIETRDVTRLMLGPDRRRDVSISLPRRDRDLAGPLGGDLKALTGRVIEVRGWVSQRAGLYAGPDFDLTLVGHVRLLEAVAPQ
jgi:micrococcal nuclease